MLSISWPRSASKMVGPSTSGARLDVAEREPPDANVQAAGPAELAFQQQDVPARQQGGVARVVTRAALDREAAGERSADQKAGGIARPVETALRDGDQGAGEQQDLSERRAAPPALCCWSERAVRAAPQRLGRGQERRACRSRSARSDARARTRHRACHRPLRSTPHHTSRAGSTAVRRRRGSAPSRHPQWRWDESLRKRCGPAATNPCRTPQ